MKLTRETAKAYYKDGAFNKAEPYYKARFDQFLNNDPDVSLDEAVEVIRNLIHIYGETEDFRTLDALFEKVESQPELKAVCEKDSRWHHALGLYYFVLRKFEKAVEESAITVRLAAAENNLNALVRAKVLNLRARLEDANQWLSVTVELSDLKKEIEELNDPEMNVSFHLLHADLAIRQKRYEAALDEAWIALDLAKNTGASVYYTASILAILGYIYVHKGEKDVADIYLKIAEKTLIPDSMYRLKRIIRNLRAQCETEDEGYDAFLDLEKRKLLLKPDIAIDLKNQFILIDLLRLFFSNPGQAYSKQQIAEKVWREAYNPNRHDNLIYVNLKRLRTLLEPAPSAARIIMRSKNGYYVDPQSKFGIRTEEQ